MAQDGKKAFDEGQRAAIETDATAIVSAGAGSGKTTVLAARYHRLVGERRFPVDSILALTFTIKATSEMFGRIYASLCADDSDFVRAQVAEFSKAQISTLDSFCARVARSGCAAWGFSPDFAVDDQLASSLCEREALAFMLEKRAEPILRKLVGLHGFERVCREVFSEPARRMCPARPWDFPAMPERLEGFLRSERRRLWERLSEIRAYALSLEKGGVPPSFLAVLEGEMPEPGDPAFAGLCRDLASMRKPNGGKPFREEADELKDAICPAVVSIFDSLGRLPEYSALYPLLGEFQDRVIASKRSANVLSFSDSSEMARQALLTDPALRSFYKKRYRAVMIDEFQDNNQLQKDLLFMLAERPERSEATLPDAKDVTGGKLFFVGDEKQSIYRFRGADVSVFRKLGGELGGAADEIFLSMNYRSEPRLIDFQNALFPAVMADPSRDFEACYQAIGSRAASEGVEPRIIRLTYPLRAGQAGEGPEPEDPAGEEGEDGFLHPHECEAWGIASFIRDSVGGGKAPLTVRGSDGKPRQAAYGDFAVLLRTTGRQGTLERFLRLCGVPYSSADLCGFYAEAPANDLYAAMRCAIYPDDAHSLAAYLRSPFANLSDESVSGILLEPGFEGWRDMRPESLPGEEAVKAARCRATLESVAAMADVRPLSSVVSFLWHEAGYREFVLRRAQNRAYLEFFDFFFALADEADGAGKTLAAFVGQLESLMGGGERLKDADPPREESSGVRVMTIHKSKGLEFPIVIIPNIEAPSASKEGGPLAHWWRDSFLTVKMAGESGSAEDYFNASCEEERKAMAKAELKRLFYVACTRAECHLVFSECEPSRADKAGTSLRGMLDGALAASGAGAYLEPLRLPDRTQEEYFRLVGESGGGSRGRAEIKAGLAAAGRLDRPAIRREFSATELNAAYAGSRGISLDEYEPGEAGMEPGAPWAAGSPEAPGEFGGPAFGSLVHALIQRELEGIGPDQPLPSQVRAGVEAHPDPKGLLAEADRASRAFLDSPLRAESQSASLRLTEYPFLLRKVGDSGECFVKGVIDLLYVKDGECVVVDYKTNLARREGEYDLQMSLYREAAAALSGQAKVRSVLFYLRSGGPFESAENPDPFPFIDRLSGKTGR
jgi:ATP-dependent helicase/nuclease subunit A